MDKLVEKEGNRAVGVEMERMLNLRYVRIRVRLIEKRM